MIKLDSKILKAVMLERLTEIGVCEDSKNHVADSLINTSLRGTDSHGINLYPFYAKCFKANRKNRNPEFKFNQTAGGTAILDADHAIGHHSGAYAMDRCIAMAKENGIASVKVDNSSHFGAASYFGLRAANADCIGFAFTNADALVKAHGGKEPFFGTNPICFTAPLLREDPFCLDMATSTISWNKLKNHRRAQEDLEEGLAFNKEGKEVVNPHEAISLAPIGGYKGFGLGMMISILCSTLTGGITDKDMIPMFVATMEEKRKVGHFFMVIDIAKFSDLTAFKTNLQALVDRLRIFDSQPTVDSVMIPGDPEKLTYDKRVINGIPILESIFDDFLAESPKFQKAVINELQTS